MANALSTWRDAARTHLANVSNLAGSNGLAFTILDGQRDGESKDRNLGCVFLAPASEWQTDVNFLRPVLVVRAWEPKPKLRRGSPSPPDPEPLEELASKVIDTLQGVRTSLFPGYFEIASYRLDPDDWGVEVELVAYLLHADLR